MDKKTLADFKEEISDDFQSTFTIINSNKLANMLGMPGDFENLTNIIKKYIPDANLEFTKTDQLRSSYDIYTIENKIST